MPVGTYPDKYLTYNTQQTKTPALVVEIPGVDTLSNTPVFTRIRYGDDGLVYGLSGIVYGGLRRVPGIRDILSLDGSSLTIGQKIEPEQGRGAISLLTLAFIDEGLYMSEVISPGVRVDDILGKPVRVYLGYKETSFPEDYFTVFRGFVTGATSGPGLVTLQLSDSNLKRRQQVYVSAKSKLLSGVNSSDLVIPISAATDFHKHIVGPSGGYDSSVRTFIKVDDEYMEYGPGAVGPAQIVVSSRGARGSAAVSHASGAEVQACVQLTGIGIDLALKTMLSGWNGPWVSGVSLNSINVTGTPTLGNIPNAFVLNLRKDAVEDYGLSKGDKFTITGSTAGNNKSGFVIDIGPWEDLPNRVVYTDQTFNPEPTITPAVASFRSQFDTFPTTCGMKLDPTNVDVASHVYVRNNFLAPDILEFFIQATEANGKVFLESQIYLPEGAYSITRYGRLSVNITKPPIADQKLPIIDHDNILNPDAISVSRMLNNRRYFNEVKYEYDQGDDGHFSSLLRILDTESLSIIGLSSVLPIQGRGIKSSQNGALIAQRRGRFLLTRYKRAAFELSVKVNWEIGSLIEAGDVVCLKDENNLKITNFSDGKRNLGVQLFEVTDRKLDIKTGNVTLSLLSNIGFDVTDRYATISPSSLVASSPSPDKVVIQESFGAFFPSQEQRKWTDYIGLPVLVRNYTWTMQAESVLQGFDSFNDHMMILDPPLPFTPTAGFIVDLGRYPTDTNPKTDEFAKSVHAFFCPSVTVVSGISDTQFTVSPSDASKFHVGLPILIHNTNYSVLSEDVLVDQVVGTTIITRSSLGFTPAPGQIVEGIGFNDLRGPYRIL